MYINLFIFVHVIIAILLMYQLFEIKYCALVLQKHSN